MELLRVPVLDYRRIASCVRIFSQRLWSEFSKKNRFYGLSSREISIAGIPPAPFLQGTFLLPFFPIYQSRKMLRRITTQWNCLIVALVERKSGLDALLKPKRLLHLAVFSIRKPNQIGWHASLARTLETFKVHLCYISATRMQDSTYVIIFQTPDANLFPCLILCASGGSGFERCFSGWWLDSLWACELIEHC